jgi:hypothetical protein
MHDLYSEIAAAIRNQGESGFIVSPNLFAALEPCAGGIYHHRIPVKAGHHSFNVVAVEGVKVALNQFFLGGHTLTLQLKTLAQIHVDRRASQSAFVGRVT